MSTSPTNGEEPDRAGMVVVVGGGPAGVAVLGALVRRGGVAEITVVDPVPIGLGNVYGDVFANDPVLLCNTPTGFMYLDDNVRSGFLDHLVARGWPLGLDDHVPRFLFGQYCREAFDRYRTQAEQLGIAVRVVASRAEGIRVLDQGYEVVLDDGRALPASDVVLCVGLDTPKLAPLVARFDGHPRLLRGGYPVRRLRELPDSSRVLVLGLRSSAMDTITVLCRNGHSVTATSPSGRVSAVRDRLSVPESSRLDRRRWLALDPADPEIVEKAVHHLREEVVAAGDGLPVEAQICTDTDVLGRLEREIEQALRGETRWADLIYEGLFTLNSLVGPWSAADRAKLLPLAYPLLTRYVNALPVLTATNLAANLRSGRLRVTDVFVQAIEADDDGWTAEWDDGSTERFDVVVCTSGFNFPRFVMADATTIRPVHEGTVGSAPIVELTKDLRLHRAGAGTPERIWAVGAACGQRYPFAHVIMLAAAQAPHVAAMLVDGADGNVEDVAPSFLTTDAPLVAVVG